MLKKWPDRVVVTLATVSLALAGCATSRGKTSETAGAVRPRVLTSFYPFEFLAHRVGGPEVTVQNLTKSGVEPHDLELTLDQVRQVGHADLLVYLKGMQPAVDSAAEQNPPRATVDASTITPLVDHGGLGEKPKPVESGPGRDPHIWLDPARFAMVAPAVADALGKDDPAHAEAYRGRAAALREELSTLDDQYRIGLAHCARHEIVTTHAAFGYLAERYGLTQISLSDLDPDADPSPAHLAQIRRLVHAQGVTTVFFESLVSPKTAQILAGDLKVRAAPLDPIEGISDPGMNDYLSVMRENLAQLRIALACG